LYLANSSLLLAPLEAERVDGVAPAGMDHLAVEAALLIPRLLTIYVLIKTA
jgi:hypothetical protein